MPCLMQREACVTFQHATEQEFRAAVEGVTGRRVIGSMSGIDVHNDLSSEVFTLEAAGSTHGDS